MKKEWGQVVDGEVDLETLRRIDPRLVALALGRIDDDELDELLQRAVEEPRVRRAVDAFWPLDDKARMVGFVRAREALTAPVHPRPHWSLMFLPSGIAVSAVASLALTVAAVTRPPPLPPYALEVSGGFRVMRSASETLSVGRFAPAASLELLFRPEEPIKGPAQAAIFRVGSREIVRLPGEPQISGSGAVRWKGTINSLLPGERGPVEVVLAVRSGTQSPTGQDVREALLGDPPNVRVARAVVVIEDR